MFFISELIERGAAADLSLYVDDNELDEPLQSLYLPHRNTSIALLHFKMTLSVTLMTLILHDMSTVVDTVDHDILLRRLEQVFELKGFVKI